MKPAVSMLCRRVRSALTIILVALVAALLPTACDHKELCFDHWDHAATCDVEAVVGWDLVWEVPYNGQSDWDAVWDSHDFGVTYQSLNPEKPSGIAAVIYSDDKNRYDSRNLSADGGILPMTEGHHSILMYNNDTRYVIFKDLDNLVSASASTRSRSRSSYLGSPIMKDNEKEHTVSCPDPLFGHYIPDYLAERSPEMPMLNVTMKPLVYTYFVTYRFDYGLQYVGLARGALSGMAGSVHLTDGHTEDDVVTFLYDAEVTDRGVQAGVNTFGIPNFPNSYYSRGEPAYGLNLEVRLRNGRIYSFDFDVTDQVKRQPHGGVIEVGGVIITDEMGKADSGSFDVTVEDWGPHEDVDLNFSNRE